MSVKVNTKISDIKAVSTVVLTNQC